MKNSLFNYRILHRATNCLVLFTALMLMHRETVADTFQTDLFRYSPDSLVFSDPNAIGRDAVGCLPIPRYDSSALGPKKSVSHFGTELGSRLTLFEFCLRDRNVTSVDRLRIQDRSHFVRDVHAFWQADSGGSIRSFSSSTRRDLTGQDVVVDVSTEFSRENCQDDGGRFGLIIELSPDAAFGNQELASHILELKVELQNANGERIGTALLRSQSFSAGSLPEEKLVSTAGSFCTLIRNSPEETPTLICTGIKFLATPDSPVFFILNEKILSVRVGQRAREPPVFAFLLPC